jgi:preprotein translocase subunit SecA
VQVEDQAAAGGAPAITVGAPDVSIEAEPAPVAEPVADEQDVDIEESDQPRLSPALLQQAQAEHDAKLTAPNGAKGVAAKDAPHIKAKGLDRGSDADRPLVYTAPELGSETPQVRTSGGAGNEVAPAGRRQRTNPNRGSRGNKSGGGNRNRKGGRKR